MTVRTLSDSNFLDGLSDKPQLETQRKLVAWNKAAPSASRSDIRVDAYGNQIKLDRYGDRYSEYGWEVDHIVSLADGGSDTPENWRAVHWRAAYHAAA